MLKTDEYESKDPRPRKAPKSNRKRKSNARSRSDDQNESNQDDQLLIDKPPINASQSESIDHNEKLKRSDMVKKLRNVRSRSGSRERLSGNVNEAYESDTSLRNDDVSKATRQKTQETINQSETDAKKDKTKRKEKKKAKHKSKSRANRPIKSVFHWKTFSRCALADDNAQILAIVVHQCDKLRTDVNIYHPLVRVHMVDLGADGRYVKKSNKSVI